MSAAGRFLWACVSRCLSRLCHPPPPPPPTFIVISPPSSRVGSSPAFYLPSARFSIEISLSRRPPREKGASFMRVCFMSSFSPLALSPSVMLVLCQKYILSWTRSRCSGGGAGVAPGEKSGAVINSLGSIVKALLLQRRSARCSGFCSINNTLQLNSPSVKLSKTNCVPREWNIARIDSYCKCAIGSSKFSSPPGSPNVLSENFPAMGRRYFWFISVLGLLHNSYPVTDDWFRLQVSIGMVIKLLFSLLCYINCQLLINLVKRKTKQLSLSGLELTLINYKLCNSKDCHLATRT